MTGRVTQFGRTKKDWEVCVLCGRKPRDVQELTTEHIPPRGLFEKSKRPNPYLVVPACVECNRNSSLDDEHLMEVLAASSPASEQALSVWRQKCDLT